MEERELRFDTQAPLLAWRLFRIREDERGVLLSSPMYHDPDPPPWPDRVKTAACHKGHVAPAPGCRCGIYAAIRGTLDSLPGYLVDTARDRDPWAYAEVACSGRVFVDKRGVRAERAEVVHVALAEQCWPPEGVLREVRRGLASRYGVRVGGLSEAPEWLTGNARSEGPPPEDASLDLDALDLRPASQYATAPRPVSAACRCSSAR